MYYLRTKPAVNPIQFTVDKQKLLGKTKNADSPDSGYTDGAEMEKLSSDMARLVCSRENKEACLMCSG